MIVSRVASTISDVYPPRTQTPFVTMKDGQRVSPPVFPPNSFENYLSVALRRAA